MKMKINEEKKIEENHSKITTTHETAKSSAKQFHLEEEDFWKDCLEIAETKQSTNESKDIRTSKSLENDQEIYLTCILNHNISQRNQK